MEGDFSLQLRGAYLTMHRRANSMFAEHGVTADQYVVLTALANGDGVSQQELVRRCYSDPNTLRSILLRLEREGLLSRGPGERDARERCVKLTEAGRRLQDKLEAINRPFQRELEALIPGEERRLLLGILARIRSAMSDESRGRGRRYD